MHKTPLKKIDEVTTPVIKTQ